MTDEESGFLAALGTNPDDNTTRAAYADWLDEHDRPYEAILQRGEAGLSEVFFKLRRKSDGLFSECNPRRAKQWTTKGKAWRKLSDLRGHLYSRCSRDGQPEAVRYLYTVALADLEIVVVETRTVESATLPIVAAREGEGNRARTTINIPEPREGNR